VAAAAVSFVVGTVALVTLTLILNHHGLPAFGDVAGAPWWVWTGRLLGAFNVFASVVLTPPLRGATTVALIPTGQVLASIAIDHFGHFRVAIQEATPPPRRASHVGRLLPGPEVLAGWTASVFFCGSSAGTVSS